MRHPFERWPKHGRRQVLTVAALASLVVWIAMALVNLELTTANAPRGILSLQTASAVDEVLEIVGDWSLQGTTHMAGFSLGLDILFIPLFFGAVAGACIGVAQRARRAGRTGVANIGIWAAWAAFAAALFDVVEDVSHLQLLSAATSSTLQGPDLGTIDAVLKISTGVVIAKYELLAAALLYAAVGALLSLPSRAPATAVQE